MKRVDPSKVYRLMYPAVPAVIACSDGGQVYAMPAVSVISLSNEPPLVGVSSSPAHSTHKAILKAKRFSLSWFDSSLAGVLQALGTKPHVEGDKLASAGVEHHSGSVLKVPIPEMAVAFLECALRRRLPTGDHELLVGEVRNARAIGDFRGYWRFREYRPVLYTGIRGGSFGMYRSGPPG
jgi:flavin reductase (DIM6/NTAB) family NADH-FMN oxidoreductase RutF